MTEIEKAVQELLDYAFHRGMKKKLSLCCVTLAIQAIERQKEKKSECFYDPKKDNVYHKCPQCGNKMYVSETFKKVNYCPDCGQHLDWGDEEEETCK